ncbi:dephospho-CoA kinase [Lentilactobacillus raoultii]|uniref:Dephospho-CoA kinase n=1 Tax=Lentilactobacillus raoultii TaxID=1987503 RepID=A0ABW3PQY0_9LACO|nr:dephospho-CoA kinase [Lentilactobacillus raoultii]
MAKVIGLTGGIATGKSTVSHYLQTQGVPIIDADIIAHQVQAPGEDGLAAIVNEFGPTVLDADQKLDRKLLGKLVFHQPSRLKRLVQVMDPFIRREIVSRLSEYQSEKIVILDAPTLFENGYTYLTDSILVVYCEPVVQMKRLRQRNHLTISQASARIKSQWPLQTKCELADTIIYNSGSVAQTNKQVEKWLRNELKY